MMVLSSLSKTSHLWFIFTELSVTFDKLNDVLLQPAVDTSDERRAVVRPPLTIRFDNVSFKYKDRDEAYVLRHINLTIKPGMFVGIVGRNGSGKSTLVKLLCRLYEKYEGRIMLNDAELRSVKTGNLRKQMAVIPQNVVLFDGTLKENIRYGNANATDEQVIEAAKLADLHSFAQEQFLGYNLRIGENGSNLSGGQKLRVAFARLFVANPDIIILDEASSALDIETERKMMRNLRNRFWDKIIISVAHRLHTLRDADHILVLDRGRLAEQGSHQTLFEENGLYREFIQTYIDF
jgi:ATP-binding cassette subfamily B protein